MHQIVDKLLLHSCSQPIFRISHCQTSFLTAKQLSPLRENSIAATMIPPHIFLAGGAGWELVEARQDPFFCSPSPSPPPKGRGMFLRVAANGRPNARSESSALSEDGWAVRRQDPLLIFLLLTFSAPRSQPRPEPWRSTPGSRTAHLPPASPPTSASRTP